MGLKTLVAGLTKSKGEGDIPSHVDDLRCLSLVLSGNSAVRTLIHTMCLHTPTPQLLVPSCDVLPGVLEGSTHGSCGLHHTTPPALDSGPCCRSTWSCHREATGAPGMSGLRHFRT